jgi:hypothetical protein
MEGHVRIEPVTLHLAGCQPNHYGTDSFITSSAFGQLVVAF